MNLEINDWQVNMWTIYCSSSVILKSFLHVLFCALVTNHFLLCRFLCWEGSSRTLSLSSATKVQVVEIFTHESCLLSVWSRLFLSLFVWLELSYYAIRCACYNPSFCPFKIVTLKTFTYLELLSSFMLR